MRYSTQTQEILLTAAKIARELGHGYVGSAHLLLALVKRQDAVGHLLQTTGMDAKMTEQMTAVLYGVGTPGLPLPQGLGFGMSFFALLSAHCFPPS